MGGLAKWIQKLTCNHKWEPLAMEKWSDAGRLVAIERTCQICGKKDRVRV